MAALIHFLVYISACLGLVMPGKITSQDKDNNMNEVLETCEFEGKTYQPGQSIPNDDQCIRCECPVTGGPTKCTGYFCSPPPCVNPVAVQGECCPQCMDGGNCWLDGRIVLADQYIVVPQGFGCSAVCWCPGSANYEKYGKDTQAYCDNPCRWKK